MRVPKPPSLRIDRRQLMDNVGQALRRRAPKLDLNDPTDPGVLLLEQAAWMVETLSERMDRLPERALAQLAQLLGLELQPAGPALGVVVLAVDAPERVSVTHASPSALQFSSPATERSWATGWVPVEPSVVVGDERVAAILRVEGGELSLLAEGKEDFPGSAYLTAGAPVRATVFDDVQLVATINSANAKSDANTLTRQLSALGGNRRWLEATITEPEKEGAGPVELTMRVETLEAEPSTETTAVRVPNGARRLAGEAIGSSGLTLRYADIPEVPHHLRGTDLPAEGEGKDRVLVVSELVSHLQLDRALVRPARPLPKELALNAWKMVSIGTGLDKLRPRAELRPRGDMPPRAQALLRLAPQWEQRFGDGSCALALFSVGEVSGPRTARVGLLGQAERASFLVMVEQWHDAEAAMAWTLPSAGRVGQRVDLTVWDIRLPEGARWILARVEGELDAAAANPILVMNAPVVKDGREVTVMSTAPEPVTLVKQHIVSRACLQSQEFAIRSPKERPGAWDHCLQSFPLSVLRPVYPAGEPIQDWAGVGLDPSAGELTLNAPDEGGDERRFASQTRVGLTWYRHTDGAAGNLPVGAIRQVESAGAVKKVYNPFPTFGGIDQEPAEAAIERLFAAGAGVPIVPADFERVVRHALLRHGLRWTVRCWTAAERRLLPWAWWAPEGRLNPEQQDLQRRMDIAGAETLTFVIGPADIDATDAQMGEARKIVSDALAGLTRRLPLAREALVVRHWLLTEDNPNPPAKAPRQGERRTYRDRQQRIGTYSAETWILDACIQEGPSRGAP